MPEQNYKNHGRVVPMWVYGVLLPLTVNVGWNIYLLGQGLTWASAMGVIVALSLLLLALSVRAQILTVQDRVIRLESRLRMRELLPPDLAARAAVLPVKQLVALRFASDSELAELVSEVLGGSLSSQKEIKLRIKDWQADHLRA